MPLHPCSLTTAQLIQPPPTTGQGAPDAGQVRIRQHLNPLARRWSQPVSLPSDWYARAFEDTSLPLIVDVGVAKGRFLLKLASANANVNYLGLEIREPLVHQANRCAADASLRNLFYIACNANVSLGRVLSDAPPDVLKEVYVQFCDPWFKKRHAKRRMVTPPLVNDIFLALSRSDKDDNRKRNDSERRVFMQSDVLEIAYEMRNIFDEHCGFKRVGSADGVACVKDEWLEANPIGVPTEREVAVLNKDLDVYRALYVLKQDAQLQAEEHS